MKIIVAGGGSSGVTGSGTDNTIPLWNGTTALDDSSMSESATEITSTKDLWIKDDNGILFDKTGGGGTQTLRIKGVDDSSTTPSIAGVKHLVIQCDAGNNTRYMFFKAYNTNFMIGYSSGVLFTTSGSFGISASAFVQIDSTTKGFLPPRMTTTQRDAISSPATGLIIYNTTTNKINVYTGAAWEAVTSA